MLCCVVGYRTLIEMSVAKGYQWGHRCEKMGVVVCAVGSFGLVLPDSKKSPVGISGWDLRLG